MTAYPNTDIASMSFVFWHKLSHVLTGREQRNASREGAEELNRRKQLFFPAYVQLIHSVIGTSFLPVRFLPDVSFNVTTLLIDCPSPFFCEPSTRSIAISRRFSTLDRRRVPRIQANALRNC